MEKIFSVEKSKLLYSPLNSIYPSKINLFTDFIANVAKIFFKIMEQSDIKYYLFAGNSIGLLRNGKSIPWVDDYDIIILINDFDTSLFDTLRTNGFLIKNAKGGYQIYTHKFIINNYVSSFFQCDIFISFINDNNCLKNVAKWGRYHKYNINKSLVDPPVFKNYDGMNLPFFNNYEKDVRIEYGDIYNNIQIHISHGKQIIYINNSWEKVYKEFNKYKLIAINNTKKLIGIKEYPIQETKQTQSEHQDQSEQSDISDQIEKPDQPNKTVKETIELNDNMLNSYLDIMKHIAKSYNNKPLIFKIYNVNNIKLVLDIKFYFPKIIIYFYIRTITNITDVINKIRFFIDFIDYIYVASIKDEKKIIDIFDSIIIFNKPTLIIDEQVTKLPIETKIIKDINIFENRLKKGSKSECVKVLQKMLIDNKCLFTNSLSTYFGTVTEEAVKRFQKNNKLPVTGIVENSTFVKLYENYNN